MARPNLEMLLKGPSVIFITSYIFTMLAALKLLKVRDIVTHQINTSNEK